MPTADPIARAVQQLKRLPGIGEKTATRLVYWMLNAPSGTPSDIASALVALEDGIHPCSLCCNLTGSDPCPICADPKRDARLVCVVEHPQDVLAFERSGEYRGRYHVLHGSIAPLDGVTPDQLKIRELLARVGPGLDEVILATDPDVEGDATALYIGRLLQPLGVKVTRLAHGISVGTEIEYADAVSLARALQYRREM
ncbi:MAG: recombination protein RecR [Alphaproteobacteria bacterium]|nr:recombination protein RecR [Alphaproteobacteria bacterium]